MSVLEKRWREYFLTVLILACLAVWFAVWQRMPGNGVRIYYLGAGKGEAILVDSPAHHYALIDGGSDSTVLSDLGEILPFGDRFINLMIETQSISADITGLVDVAKSYKVGEFIEPSLTSKSYTQMILEREMNDNSVQTLVATTSIAVDLGGGAKLEILPVNKYIPELVYGNEKILLNNISATSTIEWQTDGKTLSK